MKVIPTNKNVTVRENWPRTGRSQTNPTCRGNKQSAVGSIRTSSKLGGEVRNVTHPHNEARKIYKTHDLALLRPRCGGALRPPPPNKRESTQTNEKKYKNSPRVSNKYSKTANKPKLRPFTTQCSDTRAAKMRDERTEQEKKQTHCASYVTMCQFSFQEKTKQHHQQNTMPKKRLAHHRK